MAFFVEGILESNEIGAYDEIVEKALDRWLEVRLIDGRMIKIFDSVGPISGVLEIGKIYEFLIHATIFSSIAVYLNEPIFNQGYQIGEIIDITWNGRGLKPLIDLPEPEIYNYNWILIKTDLGHMIVANISPKEISNQKIEIKKGVYIRWEFSRFDLMAVLSEKQSLGV